MHIELTFLNSESYNIKKTNGLFHQLWMVSKIQFQLI